MFLHNGERDLWCNTQDETSHKRLKMYEKKTHCRDDKKDNYTKLINRIKKKLNE